MTSSDMQVVRELSYEHYCSPCWPEEIDWFLYIILSYITLKACFALEL